MCNKLSSLVHIDKTMLKEMEEYKIIDVKKQENKLKKILYRLLGHCVHQTPKAIPANQNVCLCYIWTYVMWILQNKIM